jgi:acyl-CoA dehydrogenase family protein 9
MPLPSFVRGIFAGALHDALVFPYPPPLDAVDLGEAARVRSLIGALRDMKAKGLIDSAAFDEQETIPEATINALAATGLLGLTIPREYGGAGLSPSAYARVFEELSRLDPSIAVLIGVHCGLGAKAIVLFGNDEQKARYLPKLARGETLAAYALTEPDVGSDAQNVKTQAHLSDDGTHWILDGRKHWIGNAHRAGVIVTFAQTPAERRGERVQRPTAFIIRPDMPGFRVVGTVRKLGIRGSTQAELAYENLEVPADHVLGTVGKGFSVAVHVLNGGRLTLAAGCTGGTKELLGEMTKFAEWRVQFGKPIADFEITQRKLARTASDVYASDAMLGELAHLASTPDGDYALEAACCKVFASEMLWRAADEMVQLGGGRGFVKPYPYERLLRDARINRIFEGTNEILRLFIALNGIQGPAEQLKEVGTALRRPLRNLGLISGFAASRLRSALGATATLDVALHERLVGHGKFLEKHVAELRAATERIVRHYRREIVDRQQELERLSDMAIELFATASVLARTQALIDARGVEACGRELALCDLFVVESGRRFRAARVMLQSPQDATRRDVAQHVRSDAGYGVSDAILDAPGATDDHGERPERPTTMPTTYDVSLPIADGGLVYPGNPEIHIELQQAIAKGAGANVSSLAFGSHTGTHVDAPRHFFDDGAGVDTLPLDVLMGPAMLVSMADDVMAVGEAELRLHELSGHTRVLIRTRNSRYLRDGAFHRDYTYLAPDGAAYLVALGVRLVGVDYLSIEQFHSGHHRTHRTLLERGVVIVEGLDLSLPAPGPYDLRCLPLRLAGLDGAPARAVLIG